MAHNKSHREYRESLILTSVRPKDGTLLNRGLKIFNGEGLLL